MQRLYSICAGVKSIFIIQYTAFYRQKGMIGLLPLCLIRLLGTAIPIAVHAGIIVHLEIGLSDDALLTVAVASHPLLRSTPAPAADSDNAASLCRARERYGSVLAGGRVVGF